MINPTEYLITTLMGTGINRATAQRILAEHDTVKAAALLREAADIAEGQRQFEPAAGTRKSAQVSENVGILRVATELRRRADEIRKQATPTGATDTPNTPKDNT